MKKQIFYEVRVEDNVDGEIIFNTYDFKTIGAAKNKMDEEKEVKSKWKDNCSKEDLYYISEAFEDIPRNLKSDKIFSFKIANYRDV